MVWFGLGQALAFCGSGLNSQIQVRRGFVEAGGGAIFWLSLLRAGEAAAGAERRKIPEILRGSEAGLGEKRVREQRDL